MTRRKQLPRHILASSESLAAAVLGVFYEQQLKLHICRATTRRFSDLPSGHISAFLSFVSPSASHSTTTAHPDTFFSQAMSSVLWAMTLAVILLLLSRVYFLRRERNSPRVRRSGTCSLAVFLGSGTSLYSCPFSHTNVLCRSSGGHTMEALSLVNSLDFTRYTPRTYIVSEGDALSIQKARALERLKLSRVTTHPVCWSLYSSF